MEFPQENRAFFEALKTNVEMRKKGLTKVSTSVKKTLKKLFKSYKVFTKVENNNKLQEINNFLSLGLSKFLENNKKGDLKTDKYINYIDLSIFEAEKVYEKIVDEKYVLKDFDWAVYNLQNSREHIVPEGISGPVTELVKIVIENPSLSKDLLKQFLRHDISEKMPELMPIEEQYHDPAARYFESYLAFLITNELNTNGDFVLWNSIFKVSKQIYPWYDDISKKQELEQFLRSKNFGHTMDFHNDFFMNGYRICSNDKAPIKLSKKDRSEKSNGPYRKFRDDRGRYSGVGPESFLAPDFSGIMLPWQHRGTLPERPKNKYAVYAVQLHRPDFSARYVRYTTPTGAPFAWGLSGQVTILLGGALNIEADLNVEEAEHYLLAVAAWLVNLGWHSFDEAARVAFEYYNLLQANDKPMLEPYLNNKQQANFERFFYSIPGIAKFVDLAWKATIEYIKESVDKPTGKVPEWLARPSLEDVFADPIEYDYYHEPLDDKKKEEYAKTPWKIEAWEIARELEHYANQVAQRCLELEGLYHKTKIFSHADDDDEIFIRINLPKGTLVGNAKRLHGRMLQRISISNTLSVELWVGNDCQTFAEQAGHARPYYPS